MKKWLQKNEEIIRYIIVGCLTTIVSYGSYYLLVVTLLNPNHPLELQTANVLSWICAVIFAYVMNRRYVFQSRNQRKGKEFIRFVFSRVITLLLDMAMMFCGVTLLHINDKIVKLLVQVVVTIANYIFGKFMVFQKKRG